MKGTPWSASTPARPPPFGPRPLLPSHMPRPTAGPPTARTVSAHPPPGAEPGRGVGVVDNRLGVVDRAALQRPDLPRLVERLAVDRRQLGDVAPDVVAAGVEALRLSQRIEDAVRPGVVAGARDPLPVPGVVGDIAVDQQVPEVSGAGAPVDI